MPKCNQMYLNHILATMLCQATKSTLRARTTTGAETGSRPSCAGVLWVHDEQQKYHLLTVFAIYEYLGPASTPNIDPYTLATFKSSSGNPWDPNRARWHQRCQAEDVCPWLIVEKVWFYPISHGKSRPNPFHHWKPSLIQRLWNKPTSNKTPVVQASSPLVTLVACLDSSAGPQVWDNSFLHPAIDPRFSTDAAPCATTFKTLEASWAGFDKRSKVKLTADSQGMQWKHLWNLTHQHRAATTKWEHLHGS